jgi:hypothetical protein
MGLDMYLNARRYLWSYPKDGDDAKTAKAIGGMFPELSTFIDDGRTNVVKTLVAEIGYWRKANAIHRWFVDNVQEGNDDCGDYRVEKEQLRELLGIINEALADTTKALELLPTVSGFIFDDQEYNEWYWQDIEYTKELLEKLLKDDGVLKDWDLYYCSSW